MSEEVEAEVHPEELDKDFVVVAGEEGEKGDGKAVKKFQWRKLTDEDSIYTKGGGGGVGSNNMNLNQDELSQGRWKKSALLERKPKDIDYEGLFSARAPPIFGTTKRTVKVSVSCS